MTAAILAFPVAPQQDLRAPIVTAARAVLRSEANHSDDILAEACEALRTWGDATDHLQADAVLLALRIRQNNRERQPVARPGLIRDAVFEGSVFVAAAIAMLVIALAGPM